MGNVLGMEKRQQIQVLTKLGWSDRSVAAQLGVYRGTVGKYRLAGQTQPKVPTDPGGEVQNQPEVPADLGELPRTNSARIRPHAETVRCKYVQQLTAQRIYQDLVEEHGYQGSYDSVKRYVKKLRKRLGRYWQRLEHPPGREAQVDFGKSPCLVLVNGRYRRVWLFKMTLSCSKHAYEELVLRQDMETFIRCHEHAFAAFGGVPEIVTLDNLKSAVIQACLYDPLLNQTYLAFATHWGFAANPCAPRRPQHKGVVERDIGYTKGNALAARRFDSLEQGNLFLQHWNNRWARTRIHGTTKCQVWKLFCDVEQPRLRPLAEKPFAYFTVARRKVDVNGLVEVEARYYRVPHTLIGEYVVVHYNRDTVVVLKDEQAIITHRRLEQRGRVGGLPAELDVPWKHPSQESQERYYCRMAKQVGVNFHGLLYRVLASDDPLAIRRARGLLSLVRLFGPATVEQAASRARPLALYRYPSIKELCQQIRSTPQHQAPPALTQTHELIRTLDEYDTLVEQRSRS